MINTSICSTAAKLLVLVVSLATVTCVGAEPLAVSIDIQKDIKSSVRKGSGSVNLCWLLDSDLKRPRDTSMQEALAGLGVGSLRFPYGHLSDNYLWHTPPFDRTEKGLRPRVATLEQAPAKWDWAVDNDGSFKDAMDFDEYMALCQKVSAEPLVVVNVLSQKYKNGPSYDALKRTAVEWVKYAKRKGYRVAFWQIGNEVDHHAELLSRDEYVKCYFDFVAAMKQADSSINVGPGILKDTSYFRAIVDRHPELVDFVSCHQYMYGSQSYAKWKLINWKANKSHYLYIVLRMQEAVLQSQKPSLPILITETGVTPANDVLGKINNTYKALWWFEVLRENYRCPVLLMRYIEANPVRGGLVKNSADWLWSSFAVRQGSESLFELCDGPVKLPLNWPGHVHRVMDERRLGAIKNSVKRGSPLGDKDWSQTAAVKMNLESTLRQRGRPRKGTGGAVEKLRSLLSMPIRDCSKRPGWLNNVDRLNRFLCCHWESRLFQQPPGHL